MVLAVVLFVIGMWGITDAQRLFVRFNRLEAYGFVATDHRFLPCSRGARNCFELVGPGAPKGIRYFTHEPDFHDARDALGSGRFVTIWYQRDLRRPLFGPVGTIWAIRDGERFRVEYVATLAHRQRLAAQAVAVALVALGLAVPILAYPAIREVFADRRRSEAAAARGKPDDNI